MQTIIGSINKPHYKINQAHQSTRWFSQTNAGIRKRTDLTFMLAYQQIYQYEAMFCKVILASNQRAFDATISLLIVRCALWQVYSSLALIRLPVQNPTFKMHCACIVNDVQKNEKQKLSKVLWKYNTSCISVNFCESQC